MMRSPEFMFRLKTGRVEIYCWVIASGVTTCVITALCEIPSTRALVKETQHLPQSVQR